MQMNIQAVVLAAGKSKRFNTERTKLLELICGQPMIIYITRLLATVNIRTILVVGYQKQRILDTIKEYHGDIGTFVIQTKQRGTGDATMCTRKHWDADHILILNGDIPLINKFIITTLYETHLKQNATLSFVTSHNSDIHNDTYGRVIKTDNNVAIIEAREFTGNPSDHCCINAGIYLIKTSFLQEAIDRIEANKVSGELHITDLVHYASTHNYPIATLSAPFDQVRGINTLQELWAVEQIKRSELIKHWMDKGVRFFAAQNAHIDLDVTIGAGTTIGCGVQLRTGTQIGKNCTIGNFTTIENSKIADHVTLHSHCVIKDSHIKSHASIGPFAHIKEHTILNSHTVIGNFVEIKKTKIGSQTKVKHLSYLGDAHIGEHVNIGAGTITCNHNGITKEKTIIADNAYIGAHSSLIAPVTIQENAIIAAGSVITENVPAHALAIARSRQINKEEYAKKIRSSSMMKKKEKKRTSSKKYHTTEHNRFLGAIKTNDSIITE